MRSLILAIFLPHFTWPDRAPIPIAAEISETPHATHPLLRRIWGLIHYYLRQFSRTYCGSVGIPFHNTNCQLSFGLILKWSDRTRLEEVLAMQVARMAGLPVPRLICYGDHPDSPHAPVSILMTRVSGDELGRVYEALSGEERESIARELTGYLDAIRRWKNPWGPNRICSIIGTAIRSIRVPKHLMRPFESEQELNEYLIRPASAHGFKSKEAYEAALVRAYKKQAMSHFIVFSHGDLKHHNIMVQGGRITGFIDWESARWSPDYWDFTTALRFASEDFWWYHFVMRLGGGRYLEELDCDRALNNLTVDSYAW